MKITMYTITECAFSKQEKEYLSGHGLQFEEKNLETNREFLTEMLAVSNNFAGTPVTKIEKDDGQIIVLKGFTAAEFDKALALAPAAPVESIKPVESVEPAQTQTTAPAVEVPQAPVAEPVVQMPPVEQAPVATAPEAPAAVPDPAMASVLNTLEQQAVPQVPVAPTVVDPSAPVIPEPQF